MTDKYNEGQIDILVVDDEEHIRRDLKGVLTGMGYNAVFAETGEEAVEICGNNNFRLAIMDLIMPGGLHGLELLQEIKNTSDDICIIVLTRSNNIKSAVQAMKIGAYDYITKPCDNDEIEIVVKKAIERCELLRELGEKHHYKNLLISKSLEDLQSPDETVRRLAAEDLGEFGSESAVDALLELFQDTSIAVQEAAEHALIQIGGENTVRKIIPMLQSNQANIRNFANEMLESMGEKAVPILAELLADDDHDIRKFSVDLLGLIGCEAGVESLVKALNDKHINVSSGAAEALGNIGSDEALEPLLEKLNDDPWLAYAIVESLGKIGNKKAVEPLINLDHGDDEVLLASKVRALGTIGDAGATKFLFSLFDSPDDFLKGQVIEALEQIRAKSHENIFKDLDQSKILKQAIPMLEDTDEDLKLSIIKMIREMECDNKIEALLPCLSDSSEQIQEATYEAIVTAGLSGKTAGLALEYVKKCDDGLTQTIVKIFGETECEETGDTVADLLKNHSNLAIREEAANTIGILPNNNKYVDNLVEALQDSSLEVKKASTRSLGVIGDPKAIDPLVSLLKYDDLNKDATDGLLLIGNKSSVDCLLPLLNDEHPLCRAAAITIFGNLNPDKINDKISDALRDGNAKVRKAAIDIIAKTGDKSYLDDLITALHDGDKFVQISAANALSKFYDPKIIDPFIALLHDPDERIRYNAIQGLMKFKDERIVYALVSLLSDKSSMVKIVALDALGEMGDESAVCHIENMLETVEDDDLFEAANNALEKLQN